VIKQLTQIQAADITKNNCSCGGKKCKKEDWLQQTKPPFILGLNSSKITNNIIASQRPSSCLIVHYSLIKQFKLYYNIIYFHSKQIVLIINLQRSGEHPNCGPQNFLEPSSGFPYVPEDFIIEDIDCKVFGWMDITAATAIEFVLKIVKVMSSVLQDANNKVNISL